MEHLHSKLERLLLDAEDCELIAKLATDINKRAFFAKLSVQLKATARDIEAITAARARIDNGDAA